MSTITAAAYYLEDVHVTEEQKSSFQYLQQMMDFHIAQLVYEKTHIRTARNLYEGRRDKEEYKYLEDTFGIETPISIKMTPLIKTRIDVLLGLLLQETFQYRLSINDQFSLDATLEQKRKFIADKVTGELQAQLRKIIKKEPMAKAPGVSQEFLDKVKEDLDNKFISTFEQAGQILIEVFQQEPTIDLKQKLKQYFLDLLVTGEAYYRTYVPYLEADPVLEICKPENIFYNKNTNHQFLSTGIQPNVTTVVHREYLKRGEILTKYGHLMGDAEKDRLYGYYPGGAGQRTIRSGRDLDYGQQRQLEGYRSAEMQHTQSSIDVLPVYHVEFLANNEIDLDTDDRVKLTQVGRISHTKDLPVHLGDKPGSGAPKKKGYRLDRYEGIRIGHDIYLQLGKSLMAPRSLVRPGITISSYNGVAYNDRNGTPYSLARNLKDLQDAYDIVTFYRDNLIANSGVNGSRINVAAIPKVLGTDFMERVLKFLALRKQGIELIDPTEEGAALFSGYGDFTNSLDGNSVQAISLVLEGIERQADIISGVNRFMYQAAEQRDAVTNVQAGVKTTSLITKDLFELVFDSRKCMLQDLLFCAQKTYVNGKRGTYLLGEKVLSYNLLPESFVYADLGLYVVNSQEEVVRMAKLDAILPKLIESGVMRPEVLVKLAMARSTSRILELVDQAVAEAKAEGGELGQTKSQLEEATKAIKSYEKEVAALRAKVEKHEKDSLSLKEREVVIKEKDLALRDRVQNREQILKEKNILANIKNDIQLTQLEREQIYAPAGTVPNAAREVKNKS
jgi:hypothetical protein